MISPPIFFIDPLSSMPHNVEEMALTLSAALYDIMFACNIRAANAVISSSVMGTL